MELEFIDYLRHRLPPHPLVRLGLGDDAAILRLGASGECVVTVDMLTDGVDFELGRVDPRRIGRKSLAVNLSDLAAMASRPVAAVVALALPRQGAKDLAVALYEGLIPLAEQHEVAIAGGDTNTWDGPLVISITALGLTNPRGSLLRSGARPGDRILVTGALGGSILGHHFDFEPRVAESLLLQEHYTLHAGIDISDGLSLDLSRLATESRCGAVLQAAAIPIADAAQRLARQRADGVSPLAHALADGEDFELLLAAPPDEAQRMVAEQPLGIPLTDIGHFVPDAGLWLHDATGRHPLAPCGWEH